MESVMKVSIAKAPIALSLLLLLALAGCAGKAFDYTPTDEIPSGQGLFTGKSGALTMWAGGGETKSNKPADGVSNKASGPDNTSGKGEIPEGLPPDRPKR